MNTIVFLFVFATYAIGLVSGHQSHAMCEPRLTVLELEKLFPHKSHFPFFIKVHRCGGSCYIHPSDQRCKMVDSHDMKIPVFDKDVGKTVEVVVQNHTRCACGCVKSLLDCRLEVQDWNPDQCRCTCKYPDVPPKDLACKAGFRWDGEDTCKCKCNLPPKPCHPRKEWNKESCGCTCSSRIVKRCQRKQKGLDYENCECVDVQAIRRESRNADSDNPKSKLYISLLIVQGVVILGLVFILINYIVKTKKKLSMTYENGISHSKTNTPSSADSENISNANGSINLQAPEHKRNSNGSVCFPSQLSKESTI